MKSIELQRDQKMVYNRSGCILHLDRGIGLFHIHRQHGANQTGVRRRRGSCGLRAVCLCIRIFGMPTTS